MPQMRHSFRFQTSFIAFLLAAVFALPAIARAAERGATKDKIDPDQTITDGCDKVLDIHGAIVRIVFVRKKLFFAVKSGKVEFKLPNGKMLFTAHAGSRVMIGPLKGAPKIGGIMGDPFKNAVLWIRGPVYDYLGDQLLTNGIKPLGSFPNLNLNLNLILNTRITAFSQNNFHACISGITARIGAYGTFTVNSVGCVYTLEGD